MYRPKQENHIHEPSGGYSYLLFRQNHYFDPRGPPKINLKCFKESSWTFSKTPRFDRFFMFQIVVFTWLDLAAALFSSAKHVLIQPVCRWPSAHLICHMSPLPLTNIDLQQPIEFLCKSKWPAMAELHLWPASTHCPQHLRVLSKRSIVLCECSLQKLLSSTSRECQHHPTLPHE